MDKGFLRTVTILFLLAVTSLPVFADDLSGTVKDLCGAVLPGATVSLAAEGLVRQQVKADAFGAFSFHGVTAGSFVIAVELTGFQRLQYAISVAERDHEVTADVRLHRDWTIKESITVSDGPSANGYARYAVEGAIRSADGKPVAGATIRLRVGKQQLGSSDVCTTDFSGRYSVEVWAPSSSRGQISVEQPRQAMDEHYDLALIAGGASIMDIQLRRR